MGYCQGGNIGGGVSVKYILYKMRQSDRQDTAVFAVRQMYEDASLDRPSYM